MNITMTPWEELSQRYIREIKTATHLYQKTRHLKSRLSTAEVGEVGIELDKLSTSMDSLNRTRRRLEQGEFRIAVVGLEKAGKSTFVNAWLGHDLLPSDTSRCTFTTTQLFSVLNAREQRLVIHTKSPDEFQDYLAELTTVAQGEGDTARRAKEDLKTISENRTSLDEVISVGERSISFVELSDIKDQLVHYVASPEIAHAVREAHLYTSRLASANGVVFYDVPGLNSGLGKHIEESREMLKDCDAIICIQRSKTPSLEASEQQLIEFAKSGDAQVSLADKLFVFLGQIDIEGSAESLSENIEKAYGEWSERAQLPRDHLVAGTAAGHLMMIDAASDKLYKQVGSKEKMSSALQDLRGAQSDTELVEACGVNALKDRITQYLQHERGQVLSVRCDETLRKVRTCAEQLFNETRKRYPEDPEVAERKAEEQRRRALNTWWRTRWNKAKRSAYDRCDELISEGVSLKELRTHYTQEVAGILSDLEHRQESARSLLFGANADKDCVHTNVEWRARLREETQRAIGDLAATLTNGFLGELRELMNTFKQLLWGSEIVEVELMGDIQQFNRRITHGLETLFLRFSIPIIDVFIQHPLATESRKKLIKNSLIDLDIVDQYYDGEEPALEQIKLSAKYSRFLMRNPLLRQAVLRIPVEKLSGNASDFRKNDYPKMAKTVEEVIEEVEGDLDLVERYLIESIFSASGLTGYFRQELSRLRDRFMSPHLEDAARAIMDGLYHDRDPLLMNELPAELRITGINIEVSNALKELRTALGRGSIS